MDELTRPWRASPHSDGSIMDKQAGGGRRAWYPRCGEEEPMTLKGPRSRKHPRRSLVNRSEWMDPLPNHIAPKAMICMCRCESILYSNRIGYGRTLADIQIIDIGTRDVPSFGEAPWSATYFLPEYLLPGTCPHTNNINYRRNGSKEASKFKFCRVALWAIVAMRPD